MFGSNLAQSRNAKVHSMCICIIHLIAVEFVLNCTEMLRNLLKWHINYILKLEGFNCFVVSASFCTGNIIEERIPWVGVIWVEQEELDYVCLFVCRCACKCGALYEAVILSILAALKQSDNPGVVNPRTVSVSTHWQHTGTHYSTLILRVGSYFIKQSSF